MVFPPAHDRDRSADGGQSILALIGYVALALALTYPLILHPTTMSPGLESFGGTSISCDTWSQLWNLWWVRHVLTHPEESLYHTRHILYPLGSTLALHTLSPLYGLLSIPLQEVCGLVAAWNIILWGALALAGWATFLLCRRWTGATAPSFLAGAAFAFSPYTMAHLAAGHLNLAGTMWLPLYLLTFLPAVGVRPPSTPAAAGPVAPGARAADRAHPRTKRPRRELTHALLAGAVLLGTAYSSLYYLAFLLMLSALVMGYLVLFRRENLRGRTTWTALALTTGIFLAGFMPLLIAIVRALQGPPFLSVRGYGQAAADLLSYVVPSFQNALVGDEVAPLISRMTVLPQEWTLYVGVLVVGLSIWGFRRMHPRWPARLFGAGAIIFLVLSLGIYLKVAGRAEFDVAGRAFRIPLPYWPLTKVPGLGNLRASGRFGILFLLLLTPLMSAGLADLLARERGRLARWLLLAGISLILAVEYVAVPLPVMRAEIPSIYEEIAREEGDFALLEVPFGVRDGSWTVGREETRFQFYQTLHLRPILSGVVSRMRDEVPRYFGAQPVTRSLIRFEQVGGVLPEDAVLDRERGGDYLRGLRVKYVLIHPHMTGARGDELPGPRASGGPHGDSDDARRGSGPANQPRSYVALAEYLKDVLEPAEARVTEEGIIVFRLY